MSDDSKTNAAAGKSEAAAPAPAKGAAADPAAADLDLTLDEIEPPKGMKEGFVGQER